VRDGLFYFVAGNDGVIVSSGYNVAGPKVDSALLCDPAVLERAVAGWPDGDRGR
jgi:2-aminobenzoate-CoA ligase